VITIEPVSKQPSISIVGQGEVTDARMQIYEAIEDENLDISKLPKEHVILTSAPQFLHI
jgi:hypothetical protein